MGGTRNPRCPGVKGGHGLALSDEDSVPNERVHFWCDACGRSCAGARWYCDTHSIDFCLDCVAEYEKVNTFFCRLSY
jgi:hypothetical protein